MIKEFKLNTIENFKQNGIDLPKEIFESAVLEYNSRKNKLGEIYESDSSNSVALRKVSHSIQRIDLESDMVTVKVLDTPYGRILKTLIEADCVDIGIRSMGTVTDHKVNDDFKIIALDFYKKKGY
jgi:hypothetical protein